MKVLKSAGSRKVQKTVAVQKPAKPVQKAGAKVKALAKAAKVQKAAPAVQSVFKTAPELTLDNLAQNLKKQGSFEIINGTDPRSTKLLGEIKVQPEFETEIKGTKVIMVSLLNPDGTEFSGNGVHLPVTGQPSNRGYGKHVVQEGAIPKQFRRGYGRDAGLGFFFDNRLGYIRLKRFDAGSYAVPTAKRSTKVKKAAKK